MPQSVIANSIADSATLCLGYAQRLLTDVTPDQFHRFARVGDQVIESNHPAFVLGHLNLYPCRVIEQLGGDATPFQPSDAENELFSPAATCVDDPDAAVYPSMNVTVDRFYQRYQAAVDLLRTTGDEPFGNENPNERMRAKFGTLGSMHSFYLGGHMMVHLGQMSAWRRAMGLGAA
ncbi:MAG: DinB family protein [Planctomycetota bacterium]